MILHRLQTVHAIGFCTLIALSHPARCQRLLSSNIAIARFRTTGRMRSDDGLQPELATGFSPHPLQTREALFRTSGSSEGMIRFRAMADSSNYASARDSHSPETLGNIADVLQTNSSRYRPRRNVETYVFAAMTSGAWMPRGNNAVLGSHPILGFVGGFWRGRLMYDLNMEFRLGSAANPYSVTYQGAPFKTSYYFGGFIGMHVGWGLINFKSTTIYGLAGIGVDGFDAVEGTDDVNDPGMSINAFAKNIGMGFQHFPKKGGVFGLEVTHNFINYQNPGGTPLDGDAISVRVFYGGINLMN